MEYWYKICLLRDIMQIIVDVRFSADFQVSKENATFHKTLCFFI